MPLSRIRTYRAFWPYYLAEHSRSGNRVLHYLGSLAGLVLALAAGLWADWRLLAAALVVGYDCAWIGHLFIEKNRPATFRYPLWSLLSDFRMLGLWLCGRLAGELRRHDVVQETGPQGPAGPTV